MTRCILCTSLLLIFTLFASGIPCRSEIIATQDIMTDNHLKNSEVSTLSPRCYIGEIAEVWSHQTGLIIQANEKDGAANETVSIFIRKMKLPQAMILLQSLMTYRQATWYWDKSIIDGKPVYELRQSNAARSLISTTNAEIRKDFIDLFEIMLKREGNPKNKHRFPDAKSSLNEIADYLLSDNRVRDGVMAIRESLSVEQQKQVLQGQSSISIPVSTLGTSGKNYVNSIYTENSQNSSLSYPTLVHFQMNTSGISPTLYLLVGDEQSRMGHGIIGGSPLKQRWTNIIKDKWLLPEESFTGNKEETVISSARTLRIPEIILDQLQKPAAEPWFKRSQRNQFLLFIQGIRLWQLHERTGLPIIAYLSRLDHNWDHIRDPGDDFSGTVKDYLKRQENLFWHKWHGDALLITSAKHFIYERDNDRPKGPWSGIRWLRKAWVAGNGYFTPEDMARAAALYDIPQLKTLTDLEFENLGSMTAKFNRPWHIIGKSENLLARLSGTGIPVSEMERALEGCLPVSELRKKAHQTNDRLITVRLRVTDSTEGAAGPRRIFWIEAVTEQGKVIGTSAFFQKSDQNALKVYRLLQQYQEGETPSTTPPPNSSP
jgi:hypothetical protein